MSKSLNNVYHDYQELLKMYKRTLDKNKRKEIITSLNNLANITTAARNNIRLKNIKVDNKCSDEEKQIYFNQLFNYINIASNSDKLDKEYVSYEQADYQFSKISHSDAVILARKVCYSFAKEFGMFFDHMYKSHQVIYCKKDNKKITFEAGEAAYAISLNHVYIYYEYNGDISDIITIVHEMMHAFIFQKSNGSREKHTMQEVLSYFMEFYAIDYLASIGYNTDDLYEYNLFLGLSNMSDLLEYLRMYTDFQYIYDYFSYINVLNGYLYGLMINEEYQSNKEMTLLKIKTFINNYGHYKDLNIINLFGFKEEDIVNITSYKKALRNQFPNLNK